jgi:proteasome component ECM29
MDSSSAAKELQLLENVEMRLALADSEEKFEGVVTNLLCPVLLKVGSNAEVVKAKVCGIPSRGHVSMHTKERRAFQGSFTSVPYQ